MRCEDCPSDMDEGLYERLRDWRAAQSKEQGLPAYCVFTDKTLMAIAEAAPSEEGELSMISGVGAVSLTGTEPMSWPSAQVKRLRPGILTTRRNSSEK